MPLVISNASPLIALCRIDQLKILKALWKEIVIPEAVYQEVVEDGAGKPGAAVISEACEEWIKVAEVKNVKETEALKAVLDDGEAEVIALGQELNANLLLLDNREPRLFASAANLNIIGTVGIIKMAWLKGLVKSPLDEIQNLRLKGFWIDDRLIAAIKNEVNKQ